MGTVQVHVFVNANILYFLRTIAEVVVPIITYVYALRMGTAYEHHYSHLPFEEGRCVFHRSVCYSFSYLFPLLLLHISPPLSPHIPPSLQFNYSLDSFSPPPSHALGPSDLW